MWIKMRTTGPARTIRPLTKGGSLPGTVDLRREAHAASSQKDSSGPNRLPVNGRQAGDPAMSDSLIDATSYNGNVSLFLKNAIVELISKSKVSNDAGKHLAETQLPFPSRDTNCGTSLSTFATDGNGLHDSEIAGAVSPKFPRWKRILDLVCI